MKKSAFALALCSILAFTGCSSNQSADKETVTQKVETTEKKETSKKKKEVKSDKNYTTTNTNPIDHDSMDEFIDEIDGNSILYNDGILAHQNEKDYGTYVIPGLENTMTMLDGKPADCKKMTPQGVCATENYVLITAYDKEHKHNSVVYMLNKQTHEYIKTIVIDGKDHLGAISYNANTDMVWLATKKNHHGAASSIKLSDMENYDFQTEKKPIPFYQTVETNTLRNDSFLGLKGDDLYLGTFADSEQSILEKFEITQAGKMGKEPVETIDIPSSAQGVSFYKDYIFLSISNGHEPSSWDVYHSDDKNLVKDKCQSFEMPERMEEIFVDGDTAYIIFESAAKAYANEDISRIDRVITVDLSLIDF